MLPILFFIFSFFHIFSICFNLYFYLVILVHRDKARIPVVYIYNMIMGNTVDALTLYILFILPILMDDITYSEFRSSVGPIFTLICTFSYMHPLYLTLLMITQRIYTVYKPMSKVFTENRIWIYCGLLVIFNLFCLLVPYFSNCQINVNQRTIRFEAACQPDRHWITLLQNKYIIIIPLISMILNIMLIIYLSMKRGDLTNNLIRSNATQSLGNRTSVASRNLPPIMSNSKIRQKFERALLVQSISTTTFILGYELSNLFITIFSDQYSQLSHSTKEIIFYSRISASSMMTFLVYFVASPTIRAIIIEKSKILYNGSLTVGPKISTIVSINHQRVRR